MIHSEVGRPVRTAGADTLRTVEGDKGYVLYGPYFSLAPGSYIVDFHVVPDGKGKIPCCNVDVVASGRRVVAQKLMLASDLIKSQGAITLPFEVEATDVYEFRVFATGRMGLSVRQERPVRLLSALPEEAAGLIAASSAEAPALFKTHFAFFEGLAKQGFSFVVRDGVIRATYNGVSFTIESTEDFQLVGEIFLVNEYNIVTPRPAVAIDIGMNAGLTSLYLARMKHIRHVHGFEPFAAPFARAERNFALNPLLATKSTRHHVGLADRNETLSVLSATESGTISVSVRGAGHGTSENIVLRDASEMLREVVEEAARTGSDVVLKVDCEGSEFAVFDSLARSGLLAKVTAVVCEWHKWWAADKTQFDIVDPLVASGFTVIDRTNPTDRYAGLFYALRTRP